MPELSPGPATASTFVKLMSQFYCPSFHLLPNFKTPLLRPEQLVPVVPVVPVVLVVPAATHGKPRNH